MYSRRGCRQMLLEPGKSSYRETGGWGCWDLNAGEIFSGDLERGKY